MTESSNKSTCEGGLCQNEKEDMITSRLEITSVKASRDRGVTNDNTSNTS